MQTNANLALRTLPLGAKDALWIALVVSASVLFSLALACASPFAAIAAVAGIKMPRRDAVIVIVATWLANQTEKFRCS